MAYNTPPDASAFFPITVNYQYDFTSLVITPVSAQYFTSFAASGSSSPPSVPDSTSMSIGGGDVAGIESISYGHGIDGDEMVYGTSMFPFGRTRGRYKAQAKMELLTAQADWLRAQLSSSGNYGYMDTLWMLQVSRGMAGFPVITDTLVGCRLSQEQFSWPQGGKAGTVQIDLKPMILCPNNEIPSIAVPNFTSISDLLQSFGITGA